MSLNVKREKPNPMTTEYPICKQCGYSHPPLPPGTICPMAAEKIQQSSKYLDLLNTINKDLSTHDSNSDLLADMLNKTIKAWRIQINKLAHEASVTK